jgi:mono/diheme cytochrome c family protein
MAQPVQHPPRGRAGIFPTAHLGICRLKSTHRQGVLMKYLRILMSIVFGCAASFAWSQAPAGSQAASNTVEPGTAQVRMEIVSVHHVSPVSGEQMYAAYCASCHGANARGDGPAASALNKRVPDLTALAAQNEGRYPGHRVMLVLSQFDTSHGRGSADMPDWYPALRSLSRSYPYTAHLRAFNLANYLKTLQAPIRNGEPGF